MARVTRGRDISRHERGDHAHDQRGRGEREREGERRPGADFADGGGGQQHERGDGGLREGAEQVRCTKRVS